VKVLLLLPCVTCVLRDSKGEEAAPLCSPFSPPTTAQHHCTTILLLGFPVAGWVLWVPEVYASVPSAASASRAAQPRSRGCEQNCKIVYVATVSNVHILASIVSIFMSLFIFNSSYSG